jgi:type I restriction enzyme M protein
MTETAQPTFVERAIYDGHVQITGEGKSERIRYNAANHSEGWSDPEEKVRAEFWAELIYKYEYEPERISLRSQCPTTHSKRLC